MASVSNTCTLDCYQIYHRKVKQSQTAMRTFLRQCCSKENLYVSSVADKHSITLLNNTARDAIALELIFLALC